MNGIQPSVIDGLIAATLLSTTPLWSHPTLRVSGSSDLASLTLENPKPVSRTASIFDAAPFVAQNRSFRASCAEWGPADLIEGVEAAILAAAAEGDSEHPSRLAEERTSHVVGRQAEVGVVGDVKEVGAGLKRKPLLESELPAQRQIDLRSAESAHGIASQASMDRLGRCDERRLPDSLSAGYFGI